MNAKPAYTDSAEPIAARVTDLISRLTLEEKVSQTLHRALAIKRLGIPPYNWWNECLHGVARAGVATVFPQAIGLAATWDTDLMARIATAISDEARAKHHEALRRDVHQIYTGLTFWSPNVNIFRDPRWGRGHETYGEDPYLTARMGVTFIRGLQGDDPRYLKVVATPKHYAVHSGPEPERHHFDAQADAQDLWDTYLPAFEACITEGGAWSIMGAYNRTNGEPCCASPTLLQEILRERWGFEGYVVSDCWAIVDIHKHHRVVETAPEAAALAVNHGCDLNCGYTYGALLIAVEQSLINKAAIDRAVTRLFTARFRLGMFDPPEQVPYAQIPAEVNASPEHAALAHQAACESIVLLKNEGLLPLPKDLASIAVIGPNADALAPLVGNYHGTPRRATTLLEGIRHKVGAETRVYTARGCPLAEGVPVLDVIPTAHLRPLKADAGQTGLTATLYAEADFEGAPVRTQIDPVVDAVWKAAPPVGDHPGDPYSVRWEGYLIPPESGVYRLGVRGFDAVQLTLDGDVIVEFNNEHHALTRNATVKLEAGRLTPLRLEVSHRQAANGEAALLWSPPTVDLRAAALKAAARADVVIMALGLTADIEGEEMEIDVPGFRGGDRTTLGLPGPQEALLREIHALGKPVVLVLMNGGALAVNWATEHVPAIVEAWYPGQAGGAAVADVLFGDTSPAGRLPVTVYRSVEDLPPFEDYAITGRTYRYFDGEVLYPFGHGLSYTIFAYSDLAITPEQIDAGDEVTVSVRVENTGERAGDEVVQLYVRDVEASTRVPLRQLRGFTRVHLAPGEAQIVTFTLGADDFALVDETGERVVEPGAFEISIGGGQPGTGAPVITGQIVVRSSSHISQSDDS